MPSVLVPFTTFLLLLVTATESSGWAQMLGEVLHWAPRRCLRQTLCMSLWLDKGGVRSPLMALPLFLILQARRQSLLHHLTTRSVVGHTTVHRISCPRRFMRHGRGFGVSQWDSAGRERSNGGFRVLGKPSLLPLDVPKEPWKNSYQPPIHRYLNYPLKCD